MTSFSLDAVDRPKDQAAFYCHVPEFSFLMLKAFASRWKVPLKYSWGDESIESRVRAAEARDGVSMKDWRIMLRFRVEFNSSGIVVYVPQGI